VQVQSNFLGDNPTNTAPGDGLYYPPTGFVGASRNVQPSDQVSAGFQNDGFDMIVLTNDGSIPRVVSSSPMFYRLTHGGSEGGGGINPTNLTIRVYSQANVLLGSKTGSNVPDCLEDADLGIITRGCDTLGRVNVWAKRTAISGADNISVYTDAFPSPTLHALSWSSGNLNLRLEGLAGQNNAIQSIGDLVNWDYVQTNLLASDSIAIAVLATHAIWFCRARWLPQTAALRPAS
jgi:hypothetical protein